MSSWLDPSNLGGSNLYDLCSESSLLRYYNGEGATNTDDKVAIENPTDLGLDSIDPFLISQPPDILDDALDSSLSPRGGEIGAVPEILELDTLSTTSSSRTAERKSSCSSSTTSLESSSSARSHVKQRRRQGRKEAPLTSVEAEQKRENHLRRNRNAARRCRAKKNAEVTSLQKREATLGEANTRLQLERARIKEEVDKIQCLITTHMSCQSGGHCGGVEDVEILTEHNVGLLDEQSLDTINMDKLELGALTIPLPSSLELECDPAMLVKGQENITDSLPDSAIDLN